MYAQLNLVENQSLQKVFLKFFRTYSTRNKLWDDKKFIKNKRIYLI